MEFLNIQNSYMININ